MFTLTELTVISLQTTNQTENVFEIEGKNEETSNAHLTQKHLHLSKEKIKANGCCEVGIDERRATGKYIGNSVELNVIVEDSENDKTHLTSLPPLIVGTPAITSTEDEFNPSYGHVDGHVRQKSILGGLTGSSSFIQLHNKW